MKKILSMVVLCALLLTALAVSSSAAAYFEQKNPNARITVKKTTGVTIDGIISDGEYEEFTDAAGNYTEWYVADNASDFFEKAGAMAESARWYFAWDGADYLYIAATWNAEGGANQTMAGGDYYGDYSLSSEERIKADKFLGMGPGLNLVSSEVSDEDDMFARLFVAIGENTATGEKMTGLYSGQNGQNKDYVPSHSDFDFSYNGNMVTVEYKVPIYELNEKFVSGTPSMFKASISLQAGYYVEDGSLEGGDNTYSWGVRLGQLGYNCDSGNTAKTHATFRLVNDVIPGPVIDDTTATDTTAPDTTVGGGEQTTVGGSGDDTTVPTGTTANGGATTPNGTTANGGATTPNNGNNGSANRPTTGNGGNASQTADFGVVAALVSAISAAGVMISKKRR